MDRGAGGGWNSRGSFEEGIVCTEYSRRSSQSDGWKEPLVSVLERVRLGSMEFRGGLRDRFHVAVLVLVMLVAGLPLVGGRVLAGHDIVTYLIYGQQTAANLSEGEVFPAWGGGFNAGYGSPALIFYPPLTNYVDAIPVLAGIPVIFGVCALALLAHLLSGLALFSWLRSAGFGRSAMPAAVVYMVAPYRFVDLYLRSALSEHWAFIWPPLILWVASSRRLNRPMRVAATALFVAALLLTNLPMAVLFGIALTTWFAFSRRLSGMRLPVVAGAGLGFVIAAFALVPQALSSSFFDTDRYYGAAAGRFRASANTLFSDGFGVWSPNTMFSLVLVLTGVLALAAFWLLGRSERRERGARLAMLGAVAGVVVASGPMGPVWDALPVISKLQFPWRVSAVMTLVLALLVARLEPRRAWMIVVATAVVAAPFSSWGRTAPVSTFLGPQPPPTAPGTVFPDPHTAWQAGSGGWYWRHKNLAEPWLLPKNQRPFLFPDLAGDRAVELNVIRNRPAAMPGQPGALVRVVEWGQVRRTLEVSSPDGGVLLWRVLPFPDMRVTVDDREVDATEDAVTGLLSNFLPAGDHVVRWTWRAFPALRWARGVSVAGLFVSVALLLISGLGKRRHVAFRSKTTEAG